MLPNERLLDTLHLVDYGTLVVAKLAGERLLCLVTRFARACARETFAGQRGIRTNTLDAGTILPNESLLDVLYFVDYGTLVHAKLAGGRLLGLVTNSAEELACRRKFRVRFHFFDLRRGSTISCVEPSSNNSCYLRYDERSQQSLAAACRQVAAAIGPHAVELLEFGMSSWNARGVGVIFEAAPVLKYAEEVLVVAARRSVRCGRGAKNLRAHSEAFMRHLTGLKTLRLQLDYDLFRQFSWTFLRQESMRDLRLIVLSDTRSTWTEEADRLVEGLVRDCFTLPGALDGETLELDFSGEYFRAAFGRRIIELLKDSGRELTFRMKILRDDQPVLDARDYVVDVVDKATTRYVSANNGIVVEVTGCQITIQSTADVHRRKPTID